jgi:thiol:disulfide interchange protein
LLIKIIIEHILALNQQQKAHMKKIKIFALASIVSIASIQGCRTAQQPQIVTQEEEIVMVSEPEKVEEQGISFYEGNLQAAFEKAKSENKLVFVDCYTTWCGPCKMLKQYTFKDVILGDYMKENYVSLAIDMETTEGEAIAKKYGIEAYPTLLFLDKYGRVVNHQVGGIGAEALLAKAEQTVRKKM